MLSLPPSWRLQLRACFRMSLSSIPFRKAPAPGASFSQSMFHDVSPADEQTSALPDRFCLGHELTSGNTTRTSLTFLGPYIHPPILVRLCAARTVSSSGPLLHLFTIASQVRTGCPPGLSNAFDETILIRWHSDFHVSTSPLLCDCTFFSLDTHT